MKKLAPLIGLAVTVAGIFGWFVGAGYTAGQVRSEQSTDHQNLQRIMPLFEAMLQLPDRVKSVEAKQGVVDQFLAEQKQINLNLADAIKRQDQTAQTLITTWNEQSKQLAANKQLLDDLKEMMHHPAKP